MRFEIGGDYNMTVEEFWSAVFFDPDFNDHLHFKGLGFSDYEIVEDRVESDGRRSRILKAHPKTPIPKPLQRLLGKSISYIEHGEYDPNARAWTTRVELPKIGRKLQIESTMSFTPKDEFSCTRTVIFDVQANIFGIGRILEKFTESALRDNYELARRATNAWFAQNRD